MKMRIVFACVLLIIVFQGCSKARQQQTIPVIYCTDLYHPPMDPDDHFDLACMFSINEFDLSAIIIDNAALVPVTPGLVPIGQMEKITGRSVPVAVGLKNSLTSMKDDGTAQKDFRQGVQLILNTLEQSNKPVTIITVGSLRDVAAAINTDKDLCSKKIDRIFVFAGDASIRNPRAFREYNVELDTLAFACVMNSGLNVYWVPCFDGGAGKNNGNSSYIVAPRNKLFALASPRLMNYFSFCLLGKKDSLFIDALDQPADTSDIRTITYKQEDGNRNLWCSHVFPYIAGRNYTMENNEYLTRSSSYRLKEKRISRPFTFKEVDVFSDLSGMVWPDSTGTRTNKIHLFEITDKGSFTAQMTSVVAHLLGDIGN